MQKKIALFQVGLHLLTSLLPIYSPGLQAAESEIQSTNNDEKMAATIRELGSTFGSNDSHSSLSQWGAQQAISAGTAQANAWLNQFGTARMNVSLDDRFGLDGSEFDMLLPVYETKDNLFFSQFGYRRVDDSNMANIGLGHRVFFSDMMLGYNAFYDRQVSGAQHERVGLGGEFARDNFKFAANGYFRLSGWQDSREFEDYSERAANGFDLRSEGYLPAWPQLGALLKYEQYFGDNVELFDDDKRQKDPYAVTVGLNYTPIPLLTFGTEYKMGKSGQNDLQANVNFTWNFGDSWNKQTSAQNVAFKRSLAGSRRDLVERNNTITLDYRKQQVISLALPAEINGDEKSVVMVNAVVKSKHPVDRIDWQADELVANGGEIMPQSNGSYQIRLPAYQANQNNQYPLTARAWDDRGNSSEISHSRVTVNAAMLNLSLTQDKTQAVANGTEAVSYTAILLDSANQPAANIPVEWRSSGLEATLSSNTSRTDSQGKAMLTVTSAKSGTLKVSALAENQEKAAQAVTFTPDAASATPSALKINKNQARADGKDSVTVSTVVADANGNPLSNATVNWSSSSEAAVLSASESLTDAEGKATVNVSSASVGELTVSVSVLTAVETSALINFTVDASTQHIDTLTTDKTTAIANGTDTIRLIAVVLDESGHPLPQMLVNWTATGAGMNLTADQSTTDAQGIAIVNLSATKMGSGTISACAGNDCKNSPVLTFSADSASMKIDAFTADKSQAVASGSDAITYKVKLVDAQGNPLSGIAVDWSATDSRAQLLATQSTSDSQGEATVALTSLKALKTTVSATASGQSQTAAEVEFMANPATAKVTSLSVSKTSVLSNNNDSATYTTIVTDANDNLVSGAEVNWSTNLNKLSAATSKTDSSGKATTRITGDKPGDVTLTAEINGDSKQLKTVRFINEVQADWAIAGDGATYNSGAIKGYPSLGFIAVAPTDGPRTLVWAGPSGEKTPLVVPAKDQNGNMVSITLKGTRVSGCSERTFNSGIGCAYDVGMNAKLFYYAADNQSLPAGTYTGTVNFAGKDFHDSNFGFQYSVDFTLTK